MCSCFLLLFPGSGCSHTSPHPSTTPDSRPTQPPPNTLTLSFSPLTHTLLPAFISVASQSLPLIPALIRCFSHSTLTSLFFPVHLKLITSRPPLIASPSSPPCPAHQPDSAYQRIPRKPLDDVMWRGCCSKVDISGERTPHSFQSLTQTFGSPSPTYCYTDSYTLSCSPSLSSISIMFTGSELKMSVLN